MSTVTKEMFDKIRKKVSEEKARGSNKYNFFRVPERKSVLVRLLPWEPIGQEFPFREGGIHFNLGTPINCPRLISGDACPICEERSKYFDSDHEEDKQMVDKLRPTVRYYMNIIVRGEEDKGPQILEAAKTLWEDIVNYIVREINPVDITDPVDGFDLILSNSGEGADRYKAEIVTDRSPLSEDADEIEQWVHSQENLDEYIPSLAASYEEIQARLTGEDEETADSYDEEASDGEQKVTEKSGSDYKYEMKDGKAVKVKKEDSDEEESSKSKSSTSKKQEEFAADVRAKLKAAKSKKK